MELIVETDDLTKYYGSVVGIDGLTMDLPKGAYGLLGPNGSGKSTTIRVLLGLLKPNKGSGTVFGFDIENEGLLVRQRIGYMPENPVFIPDMKAIQFVQHFAQMSGLSKSDALQRAHETLFYVGLEEARYREIGTFSQGVKQRVKLAQALSADPDYLLLDEPVAGCDPRGRTEILNLISNLVKDEGKSVLVSSHLLPDVERVCDNVIVLNKGKLVTQGKISELQQASEGIIDIRVRGDSTPLAHALKENGLKIRMEGNVWKVESAKQDLDEIFSLIVKTAYEIKVQVRFLGHRKDTLEDLFMQILAKENKKES